MAFDDDMLSSARREIIQAPMLPLMMVNNQYINISNEIPRGVKAHTFQVMQQYGVAQVMTTRATNVPLIADSMTENLVRVFPVKIGFEVDDDTLELARDNGQNPFVRLLQQARDASDQRLDLIGFNGEPGTTLLGISNYPGITIIQLPNNGVDSNGQPSRKWSDKTAIQVLSDLNTIAMSVNQQTAGTVNSTRILMGHDAINYLINTPFNTGTGVSILATFLQNQSAIVGGGIRSVEGHPSLDNAGTNGKCRSVTYNTASSYNNFHIPTGGGFQDTGIQRRGDLRVVETKTKTAGVEIQRIREVVYTDIEL